MAITHPTTRITRKPMSCGRKRRKSVSACWRLFKTFMAAKMLTSLLVVDFYRCRSRLPWGACPEAHEGLIVLMTCAETAYVLSWREPKLGLRVRPWQLRTL